MALVLWTGCGTESSSRPKTAVPVVKECKLPDDQAGTLSARWKVLPVPIAIQSGQFNGSELDAISAAVTSWNAFYGESLQLKVLNGGGDKVQEASVNKPGTLCGQGIVSGDKYTGQVLIYKQAKWPYPNKEAIALTSFCPIPAKPLPNIYMAIMEVNYENFFIEGRKIPDLQSIFLHEFGHLLGLDHSCNTAQKNGFPLCSDSAMPENYFKAVMFPVIPFQADGKGEQRRELNDNDQGRANCLYSDMKGTQPAAK